MRRPRLKAPAYFEKAYYHCVSRIVNREFVLQEEEKGQFVAYMRVYEELYGLRVLSYCVMSNHFHILVEVPKRPEEADLPDDYALVAHVRRCLGEKRAEALSEELKKHREAGNEKRAEEVRERWLGRMWDVSAFMKVLKQRFTQWFNGKHGRRGTLWEDRFRSVLIQGESHALRAMAAYIDLNPVRAGICEDPKDYRWSGYGEAVGAVYAKKARAAVQYLASFNRTEGVRSGKARIKKEAIETNATSRPQEQMGEITAGKTRQEGMPQKKEPVRAGKMPTLPSPSSSGQSDLYSFKESQERWRRYLFGLPEDERAAAKVLHEVQGARAETPHPVTGRKRISREKALEVLKEGGKLSFTEYLQCKVRYFSDGAALGARSFVEEVFQENREHFSEKRKNGAHPLRGLAHESKDARLYNLRALQKRVWA